MDMKIVTLEPMRLACVRIVGPFAGIPKGFEMLMGWAGPKGLLDEDTRVVGVYWDDPSTTPEEEFRSDACITVPAGTEGDSVVEMRDVSGEWAMGIHVGAYDTLSETYAAVMQFAAESGREFRHEPPMEIYLDGPETPAEETRTEVYVALA